LAALKLNISRLSLWARQNSLEACATMFQTIV